MLAAENANLQAAMADSLEEAEVRKAAEAPLREWKTEDLLERFKSSAILAEVLRSACTPQDPTGHSDNLEQP